MSAPNSLTSQATRDQVAGILLAAHYVSEHPDVLAAAATEYGVRGIYNPQTAATQLHSWVADAMRIYGYAADAARTTVQDTVGEARHAASQATVEAVTGDELAQVGGVLRKLVRSLGFQV